MAVEKNNIIVIDLYNRKVIGWSISNSLKSNDIVIPALETGIKSRTSKLGVIFYSDRCVQYACAEFVMLLKKCNVVQSMSRKVIVGTRPWLSVFSFLIVVYLPFASIFYTYHFDIN